MVATAQRTQRSRALTAALALVAIAAASTGNCAFADSMMNNPAMQQTDLTIELSHYHPSYGAITPAAANAYVIPTADSDDSSAIAAPSLNPLPSATSSDNNGNNDNSPKQSATFDPSLYGTVSAGAFRQRQRALEASKNTDIDRLDAHFGTAMERNVDTLYAQFASAAFTPAPWPSSYWPIYADGINYRYAGANVLSPAEKYATAFGLNVQDFMDTISKNNGILSQNYRQHCSTTTECAFLKDGSVCGIRTGSTRGYCIPGWFGICHAWAPAAILENEPQCAVTKGNTTFQPMDIKALLTQVYDGARVRTVFTGSRFDGPDDDSPASKDAYGRYVDAKRRDLDPGFFHIAVTNILGQFNSSFVVDVTAGSEVWNQPVRDYQIVQVTDLSLADGASRYFNTSTYPFNTDAVTLAVVHLQLRWIVEAVEDGPLVASGKVESYTTTGDYTYVLELDAKRNIIGGEWIGESRTAHPDFLWFPTAKPDAAVVTDVGLSYAHVSELLEQSIQCANSTATAPSALPTPTPTPTPPSALPTPTPTPTPLSDDDACATPAWGRCGNQQALRCCPSGQYCQAWDTWTYQCLDIPSTCPQQFTNVDFYGNDIVTLYGQSPAACCDACGTTAGCKAYTFVNENPSGVTACYLKSSDAGRRQTNGAVSGIRG